MTSKLAQAISDALEAAISRSSDGLVRLDLTSGYPIGRGISVLTKKYPGLIIGLLEPNKAVDLSESGAQTTTLASEMTALRNAPRQDADPVVYWGKAVGKEESGLRDIGQIVEVSHVIDAWQEKLGIPNEDVPDQDQQVAIRREIAEWVLTQAKLGNFYPPACEGLLSALEDFSTPLHEIQRRLYLVDLLPDEMLVGHPSRSKRLQQNLDTRNRLLAPETGALLERLRKSKIPAVVHAVRWVEARNADDLSLSELQPVLEALAGSTSTDIDRSDPGSGSGSGPNPIDRPHTLMNVLCDDKWDTHARAAITSMFIEAMPGDAQELGEIDEEIVFEGERVSLRIQPPTNLLQRWVGGSSLSGPDEPLPSDDQVPLFLYGQIARASRESIQSFTEENLVTWALQWAGVTHEVDTYIAARNAVVRCRRILTCSDEELLLLIALDQALRRRIEAFIEAWTRLLQAGTAVGIPQSIQILPMLEATWLASPPPAGQATKETHLNAGANFAEADLAPWHPWRLGPITQLANEIATSGFAWESVTGTRWAVDRSVPAYRLLGVGGGDGLSYKTTEEGHLLFGIVDQQALTPLSGKSGALQRTLRAYARNHPWSEAGPTLTIINPPSGGGIREVEGAARQSLGTQPALTILRTEGLLGQDSSDDFDYLVGLHTVPDPGDWLAPRGNEQDVSILFLPPNPTQIATMFHGAHGAIDIALEPTAIAPDGSTISNPVITVSSGSETGIVDLLHQASGKSETPVARHSLTMNSDAMALIERTVAASGWAVVAIPGAVGAADVRLTESPGQMAPRVAEFDEGLYRCFVYARDLAPLEWSIEDKLRTLPVSSEIREQLTLKLADIARTQPQKIFELAMNRYGEDEALGVIVAREFARALARPGSLVLELSLDDTSWTQHWLDRSMMRADLVLLDVSAHQGDPEPVRIIVVEAKTRSAEFKLPSLSSEPFDIGFDQVESTMNLFRRLIEGHGLRLSESIRLRAFTEQVAAVAAFEYLRAGRPNSFSNYFANLSTFLTDPTSALGSMSGLVVALFTPGLEDKRVAVERSIRLVSCSTRALEEVLSGKPYAITDLDLPTDTKSPSSEPPNETHPRPDSRPSGGDADPTSVVERSSHGRSEGPDDPSDDLSTEAEALATDVVVSLRLRSTEVGKVDECRVSEGPTFVTITLPFARGASIAPLQRATRDIAREIGAQNVEIDNDDAEGRIQILVPKADRQFPRLPDGIPALAPESYLPIYVGVDLSGQPVISSISSWPHALVAGTTGSGKTTFLRAMLRQLPGVSAGTQVILVDGKGEADYIGELPSETYHPDWPDVMLSADDCVSVMEWLANVELPRRKSIIVELARARGGRVDARTEYLEALATNEQPLLSPLVVIIDEFAEVMLRSGPASRAFVDNVASVAQTARSVLVHLVLATQRPDRKIIPGRIHANLDTKVALRVPTPADSMTVLGRGGAERLLGAGDMLFSWRGSDLNRLQAYTP